MKIHVVQKGDTLWELAKKYGADFEELKQLNPQLSSPDMIMPGMKIKIPGSTKAVQKESMKPKETQKPLVNQPYKEMSPKPMPVIKEDVKEKQKPMQPQMPMQPHMPMQPEASVNQIQPIIQMPIMEQEMQNYTSINFPEMPHYPEPKEKPVKHEKPMPQPQPMPQPVAMVPMCCHVVHPCHPPMPHDYFPVMGTFAGGHMPYHQPMNYDPAAYPSYHHHDHHDHGHMMESPSMEMPVKPVQTKGEKDCGCKDKKPFPKHYPGYQMNQPPAYGGYPNDFQPYHGFNPNPQQAYGENPAYGQMYPPHMTPTNQPFPAPPGYPDFSEFDYRSDEDESSGE
ncbi:SpoIVD-associated factor A [Lentibacillus populi]|uniref:SpoIVD-associated factor A n=1 Tax=Lentibacillus populi TaxID=1827502 RepID=A0A9W5X3M3_9BACI|nr:MULTISPECIES: SafA/ExsA family spore coat assembly protein [Bacillaceae]MBT2215140.1 SafA/ExsA family spore coat assembly protein [Virgibacillus dakarensis]GGB28346.1 SpoIVD-associated factor A [Lentibacillus populi]